MTLGATAYSVGGETPSVQLRQKTYAINIMSATAVSCLVLQVMPYMINSDELNLGGKSKSCRAHLVALLTAGSLLRLLRVFSPDVRLPLLLPARDERAKLRRASRNVSKQGPCTQIQELRVPSGRGCCAEEIRA